MGPNPTQGRQRMQNQTSFPFVMPRKTPATLGRSTSWLAAALALALVTSCSRARVSASSTPPPIASEERPLAAAPKASMPPMNVINDPIEPVNRGIFAFNDFLISWVFVYYEDGYRFIFPAYVRTGIGKIGKNLAWPDRFVASLLRGQSKVASIETGRFLVNTTVGLAGFYDPAVHMGMKPHIEDFGKTFHAWGAGPGFAFQIPFLGPSSGRDAGGKIFDAALAPATYVPGVSTFFSLNDLSFHIDDYERLLETQADSYVNTRDAMALARQAEMLDDQAAMLAAIKPANVPTLKAVLLLAKNPKFQAAVKERRVKIAATGRKLTYSYWMQPRPAPLIYILPGTGGHRLSSSSQALAEIAWRHGFSAVIVSSSMTRDFMDAAASTPVPGYPPADAQDAYGALNRIHHDLERAYPGRVTKNGLIGLSLGGMHALLADRLADDRPADDLHFDRVVAVCPPVDLRHALDRIDAYYDAPLAWPAAERDRRVPDVLLRAALLVQGQLNPAKPLPFDLDESRFLIGLNFRLILRDVIYESQRQHDSGVLHESVRRIRRQPAYDEIMQFSFGDYIDRFVAPYYRDVVKLPLAREAFLASAGLRPQEAFLKSDARARVFINDDDFLLTADDIAWFKATLGSRLTVMTGGGHLGNLYLSNIQAKIFGAFDDLKPAGGK
jgi:phospholipid-binding lipoprotein MlaA